MKSNVKTQIGASCSIFVKIIVMKEFKSYINCYLDSIEKVDKNKYQEEFPWVNDKLFNEQWNFGLKINSLMKAAMSLKDLINKS